MALKYETQIIKCLISKSNNLNLILRFRWRDTTMLPLSTENLEQTAGYGLHIRRVGIRDLG